MNRPKHRTREKCYDAGVGATVVQTQSSHGHEQSHYHIPHTQQHQHQHHHKHHQHQHPNTTATDSTPPLFANASTLQQRALSICAAARLTIMADVQEHVNHLATKEAWAWRCRECSRECVPIRAQSRCLCGHRLAAHSADDGHACATCPCPCFKFIVAEGAWILKCRCKHKHTDHAPAAAPHACAKPGCLCAAFDSPWVCNCDHPWSAHEQLLVSKQVVTLGSLLASSSPAKAARGEAAAAAGVLSAADLVCEVNMFDSLQRGKDAAS